MSTSGKARGPVFVTGASGFVGASVVRRLVQSGAKVHALVRPASDLWRLEPIFGSLTIHTVDLREGKGVRQALEAAKPDFVIHTAAHGGHHECVEIRAEAITSTIAGTFQLLEVLSNVGLRKLVYTGSSLEYGKSSRPHRETSLLKPDTYRGVMKAATTLLCQQFCKSRGIPTVCLRLFTVFGPWDHRDRLILSAIQAARQGTPLPLTTSGFRRDFVFIDDVVEACICALKSDIQNGEVINIGSGAQVANEAVVALIEELTQQKIRVLAGAFPKRDSDTRAWVADISRARELLHWKPRHTLRAGLEKTVHWYDQWLRSASQ